MSKQQSPGEAHTAGSALRNPQNLRVVHRTIASLVIISADGKVLMGRKDPEKGGVYPNAWHIPGGGIEPGESLEEAAQREGEQEIIGLNLDAVQLTHIPLVGHGETTKTLPSGEKVWVVMEFNRFEARLLQTATELGPLLRPGDDLAVLHWFSPEELADVEQIPGGREFFIEAGYISVT